jgi:histidyl-tRNA synthetase
VFEGFDTAHSLRAIFGGGRYDNLLSDIGGKPATAVGLGFGDVVIAELLADKGILPHPSAQRDVAVAFMDDTQRLAALQITRILRESGINVDVGLHPEKPKNFFGRAGKGGFRRAILVGPDDLTRGTVRIKNLADRTETEMSLSTPPA